MHFFSDYEKEGLNALKNELISPKKYFFHGYKDFSDFKEINKSMCYWQWHYFQSACSLLVDTLTYLGRACYSLVSLQLSVSGAYYTKAAKTLASAFVKLCFDITLLCLHLVRFLSLFIATFFPAVACYGGLAIAAFALTSSTFPILGMILGLSITALGAGVFISSNIIAEQIRDEASNSIEIQLMDMKVYKALHFKVIEERNQIISKLKQIRETPPSAKLSQTERANLLSFFSNHESLAIRNEVSAVLNEGIEIKQLISRLFISLRQYPEFSLEAARNDPNYVLHLHDELHEHHTIVTMLADEYFDRIEQLELFITDYSNASI